MSIDRTKYMSLAEVHQLRAYAKSQGGLVWLVVDMALSTGLRVGELAAIRTNDIDFKRGFLTVIRLKKKDKKPDILPLGKDILKHLRKSINGQAGALFIGQRGQLTAQGLQRIWKKAVIKSGLQNYSIHSARHTHAVDLMSKTKNLRLVQKRLGHSDPAITAKYYADVTFEEMKNAVDNLY